MIRPLLAVAVLALSGSAWAVEPIRGRAGDLDLAFIAEGGATWCGPAVDIRLDAPRASIYSDRAALEPILGRLRGAVTFESECPAARLIKFSAYAAGTLVQTMEMAKAAEWVLVWADPATGRPGCLVGASDADCGSHADAYLLMRDGLSDPRLHGSEMLRFLDPTRDTLVEWMDGSIKGLVREIPKVPEIATLSASGLRTRLLQAKRAGCGNGQMFSVEMPDARFDDRSRQVFRCPVPGRERFEAMVVLDRGDRFLFFDMATSEDDLSDFDAYTAALLEALPGMPGM